jgi:hypothetical protein
MRLELGSRVFAEDAKSSVVDRDCAAAEADHADDAPTVPAVLSFPYIKTLHLAVAIRSVVQR